MDDDEQFELNGLNEDEDLDDDEDLSEETKRKKKGKKVEVSGSQHNK